MKKGMTLIELLIAISIINIILIIHINMFVKYISIYNIQAKESREEFYLDQAYIYIEGKIKDSKNIEVENNKIKMCRKDGKGYDWIRMDRQGDLIVSYGSCYSFNSNNIIKNIKKFSANRKENVIYLSIENKKGNRYEKCFGIEQIK